jgi:L-asparaginase II
MQLSIEVQAWRGAIAESRHRLEAAVVDAEGRLQAGSGEPRLVTSFRSSAKPFQLLALVERGHADRWGFSDEQLAVMAASHTGSPYHLRLVSGILERIGVDEGHLACRFHEPLDPESLADVRAHPEKRGGLYNNCSGKHAGMLALAVAETWPIEGYERPEHPVQQLALRAVSELCGIPADELVTGTDDCGVVVFGLPLAAMARGYARLASAMDSGDDRERALHRIRRAMTTYPAATGGAARFSTHLMEATRGRLLAKGGAEGLECVGIPARGLGLTLKCIDGSARALGPATLALLEHLGELSESERERLAGARRPVLRNHAGREVGRLEAVVRALAPTG